MIHGDRHTSSPNVAFEANEFLNYSYPLQQDEGELILPGSQKFPFCMILPRGLPPTITATLNDCNGGECEISYYVEAELIEANGTCLKHEVAEFSVRNSGMTSLPTFPLYTLPTTVPMALFDVFRKGEMVLGLYSPTCVLTPSQPFQITYLIHNRSSAAKIKSVTISFVEVVNWTAHNIQRETTRIIYQKRLVGNEVQCVPMIPENMMKNDNDNNDNNDINHSNNEDELLQEWKKLSLLSNYTINDLLMNDINDNTIIGTMKSDLIQVKYMISMKVNTQIGMNNPEITLPVFLYPTIPSIAGDHPHSLMNDNMMTCGQVNVSSVDGVHIAEAMADSVIVPVSLHHQSSTPIPMLTVEAQSVRCM